MDDLPKFLGPWEEHYAKRQAKFNMQLAAAVAFFLTTSFVVSRFKKAMQHGVGKFASGTR